MNTREIVHYSAQGLQAKRDCIALEAKLELEIMWGAKHKRNRTHIADLLCSPGHEAELALGLMFSLGIISSIKDVINIAPCPRGILDCKSNNRIIVELSPQKDFAAHNFSLTQVRHAGCGLCGNTHDTPMPGPLAFDNCTISPRMLIACEKQLKPLQYIFNQTGGTHAAALFDLSGFLLGLYEDVGRHNALDKLIGSFLKQHALPLNKHIVLLSSRGSFELLQKAHMAQIPVVGVVGAVSSLALDYAEQAGITLVGFLRAASFNIYTHPGRITEAGHHNIRF